MKKCPINLLLILLAGAAISGCATQSLEFYERGKLQDPIMAFDSDSKEVHWFQKSYYSREGSVGGIGSSAGGGCGCY
jgi:hypothetical protein